MPDTMQGCSERGPCGRHCLFKVHRHLAQISLLWVTNRADSQGMERAALLGSREWLSSTLCPRGTK